MEKRGFVSVVTVIDAIIWTLHLNKDENVHRFALSGIRGELLEGEREREREKEKERDSFGILYRCYLLSKVKIKRERKKEREREKERNRERKRANKVDKKE